MNKKIILAAAMLMAFAIQSQALDTNTWNFSTNADYYIAPSDQPLIVIDTTQSVARLILLSENIYHTTFAEYVTNGSAHVSTKLGPDMSLALQRIGAIYQSPGSFTSRVLDGGPANTWQRLASVASGRQTLNSRRNTSSSLAGLAALYHMDGDWIDSKTGAAGTTSGSPGFSGEAPMGLQSGNFLGGSYLTTANAALLNGKIGCTISFWIKILTPVAYSGFVYTGLGNYSGVSAADDGLGILCYSRSAGGVGRMSAPSALRSNQWSMVTYTWDGVSGVMRLYIDAKELSLIHI